MSFVPARTMSPIELKVISDGPEYYVACAFRGRSKYDRFEASGFDEVCVGAATLYEDRPVGIYAIGGGVQAMIGTWVP